MHYLSLVLLPYRITIFWFLYPRLISGLCLSLRGALLSYLESSAATEQSQLRWCLESPSTLRRALETSDRGKGNKHIHLHCTFQK